MTDGAARTLSDAGNTELAARALPHLTSRDPREFWTSGQWMTESTGGSDVGISETIARQDSDGRWRLYGRKWFTSAVTSRMALTLARPDGNPAGGKDSRCSTSRRAARWVPQQLLVHRLKDKLGTRKVPTAELTLDGAIALPVQGLRDGIRNIAPMLNVTRTWNSVSAVSYMRRGIALARDYARKRIAFGAPLADKPLHLDTLAGMQAELEAAFHLTFFLVEMIGRDEAGTLRRRKRSAAAADADRSSPPQSSAWRS
jgi:alkylation response protein AidB-like acyl-CoA dehydrogenase